jgi:thiol-disulfide isomerase/thioredoxin
MKSIVVYITFISISLAFCLGCDYVKNVKDPEAPKIESSRKVLIEDYTGHKCGNCPAAAIALKYLENKYPSNVVPLAIHAGFFATVNSTYTTNLQTTDGNAYDSQFGNSAAGNPNGLINRVGYGTGGFIKSYTSWESELVKLLLTQARFEIKIKNSFSLTSSKLNTSITVKSLTNNSGKYKLVVLLSEDSIIAEQLDYTLPSGSQFISNYQFNHVLRGAVNSTWGDAIFTIGAVSNDSIVKSYTNFSLNPLYNPAKCHVIAYVYDADPLSPTYYEILQVEEAKVK